MECDEIHIGKVIEWRLHAFRMNKSEFSRRLGIARQNIEKAVLSRSSIDTYKLQKICEILDYNFFALYAERYDKGNKKDYNCQEIRANLTIEIGAQKQDKSFRFVFGENDIKITEIS